MKPLLLAAVIIASPHAVYAEDPTPVAAAAEAPAQQIRKSPDGKFFVGWFDHDFGQPVGELRAVVLRSSTDFASLFSFVSSPRGTQAAWNPSSTRCVIADAPDNGGPITWLVSKGEFGEWVSRKIDPFSVIEKAYYKADKPPRHPFRPAFSKIEWITDTKVRFRSHCNSGTYLLTVDVTALKKPPETQKISDDPRFQE